MLEHAQNSLTGVTNHFDVEALRAQFPTLHQEIHGKPLVYLDNGASTQTPQCVIDALVQFYTWDYSNIHRGVHELSGRATVAYEQARQKIQHFLNARDESEIIFVRGTTEAINLVAHSYGNTHFKAGDEVLITGMEHHSNIVPWQILEEKLGIKLKVVPLQEDGSILLEDVDALLNERTKLVSMIHISNALGTLNPVEQVIEMAHARGIPVMLDGAQAVAHVDVDVQKLDVDFYAFSGHKLFGPTGVGVLYGKKELLDAMEPYQGGGDMISTVSFEGSTWAELPSKFEAGTPNIGGGIGLGAAIDFMNTLDMKAVQAYEDDLLAYGTRLLEDIPGVRIVGTAEKKASVLSFVIDGIHPHDIGTVVDRQGVAIRAGHHCAQPVMTRFGIPATARASLALYNTREELDVLAAALQKTIRLFG